ERGADANVIRPWAELPKQKRKQEHGRNGQPVADVHGAEEVALLPFELQSARRAPLKHREPSAIHGTPENRTLPAARALIAPNTARGGNSLGRRHQILIAPAAVLCAAASPANWPPG